MYQYNITGGLYKCNILPITRLSNVHMFSLYVWYSLMKNSSTILIVT